MGIKSTYSQLNPRFFMGPQWDHSDSKPRLNSLQLRLKIYIQQKSHAPNYEEWTLVLSRNTNHTQVHEEVWKMNLGGALHRPRAKFLIAFSLQTEFLLHHQQPEFWLA